MTGGVYKAEWADLGLVEYLESARLQKALREKALDPSRPGTVVFLEHPPTITLGYSLKGDEGRSNIKSGPDKLAADGVKVVQVDRGGKATYHGPGQIVCYAALNLKGMRLGVKRYVGKLEALMLKTLFDLGLKPYADPEYPGVWVGGAKVAAIGIRVAENVTTHGFALNVDPDLAMFGHIVPCGITDKPVTSLKKLGAAELDRKKIIETLAENMAGELRIELVSADPLKILSALDGGTW